MPDEVPNTNELVPDGFTVVTLAALLIPKIFAISSLTLLASSGDFKSSKYYLLSLLTYDASGSGGDKNFVFTQATPSSTWTVTHNLGKFPSVSVVNSSKAIVYGNVNYINTNELTITFSAPFSGQAFLN